MTELTIFTAATGDLYEAYAAPYAVAALVSNPNAVVEILLPQGFHQRRGESARMVERLFPNRVLFREHDFGSVKGSVARFIVEPLTRNEYLYIGDIDILMLQSATERHLPRMRALGMRYSNNVRPLAQNGTKKLTGLHFSEFDFYHPVMIPEGLDLTQRYYGFDEDVLYMLVSAKTEPNPDYDYRPTLGYHMSPHGWPLHPTRGWGVQIPQFREGYERLIQTYEWKAALQTFDAKFRIMLDLLTISFEAMRVFPEAELDRVFALRGKD